MPKFLVASLYIDRDIDLMGSLVSALTPFDALIKDCMVACKVEDWEACQLVETESWHVVIWRIDDDGPVEVLFDNMDFPWGLINQLTARIEKICDALVLVGKLGVLTEIPGMSSEPLDVAPARAELTQLKTRRTAVTDAWEKRKEKPVEDERPLRSVQVDSPEEADDDVVPF